MEAIKLSFGRDTITISQYMEDGKGNIIVLEAYTDTWIKKIYHPLPMLLMLTTKKKYQAALRAAIGYQIIAA